MYTYISSAVTLYKSHEWVTQSFTCHVTAYNTLTHNDDGNSSVNITYNI